MAHDPEKLLPFCMRCFGVGFVATRNANFCHKCGSHDTCINLKYKEIKYMSDNIDVLLKQQKPDYIKYILKATQIILTLALLGYTYAAVSTIAQGGIFTWIGIITLTIIIKFWNEIKNIKELYR